MSNLSDFYGTESFPFGGTGSDGDFDPQSNYTFSDAEGS